MGRHNHFEIVIIPPACFIAALLDSQYAYIFRWYVVGDDFFDKQFRQRRGMSGQIPGPGLQIAIQQHADYHGQRGHERYARPVGYRAQGYPRILTDVIFQMVVRFEYIFKFSHAPFPVARLFMVANVHPFYLFKGATQKAFPGFQEAFGRIAYPEHMLGRHALGNKQFA